MRNQLSKLSKEIDAGRCYRIDSGYLVEQVRQPHELGVEGHVHAPNGIVYQLATDCHLVTNGFLTVVHHGSSNVEILVKGIIQIKAQQRLTLHTERGLVFQ